MGLFGEDAIIKDFGVRLRADTGKPCSQSFLVQRISIAIQRGSPPHYTKRNIYSMIYPWLIKFLKDNFLCGSLNEGLNIKKAKHEHAINRKFAISVLFLLCRMLNKA